VFFGVCLVMSYLLLCGLRFSREIGFLISCILQSTLFAKFHSRCPRRCSERCRFHSLNDIVPACEVTRHPQTFRLCLRVAAASTPAAGRTRFSRFQLLHRQLRMLSSSSLISPPSCSGCKVMGCAPEKRCRSSP
jgi:hypothetical protein